MQPPADPSVPPQDPTAGAPQPDPGSPPMASPEEIQQLQLLIQSIRSKLGGFHAQNFAAQNVLERTRRELLRQVFEKLQLAGVDLTSPESVAAFIAKLQQQNPQLAIQFEQAMEALLKSPTGGKFATPANANASMPLPGANNENINANPNEALPQGQ